MRSFFLSFSVFIFSFSGVSQTKKVITNYEYRQFVEYVRDSVFYNSALQNKVTPYSNYAFDEFRKKIDWQDLNTLCQLFPNGCYTEFEKFKTNEIDIRKLKFSFKEEPINVYPNVSCWIDTTPYSTTCGEKYDDNKNIYRYDYLYDVGVSANLVNFYFTHHLFDDYPVQGLSAKQLKIFEQWKSNYDAFSYSAEPFEGNSIKINLDTSFYKITYAEYSEFIKHVMDSLIKLNLYYNYNDSTTEVNYKSRQQIEVFLTRDSTDSIFFRVDSNLYMSMINFDFVYINNCEFTANFKDFLNGNIDYIYRSVFMNRDIVDILPNIKTDFAKNILNSLEDIATFYKKSHSKQWSEKLLHDQLNYYQAYSFYYFAASTSTKTDKQYETISDLIGQTPVLLRKDWENWVNGSYSIKSEMEIEIPTVYYHQ